MYRYGSKRRLLSRPQLRSSGVFRQFDLDRYFLDGRIELIDDGVVDLVEPPAIWQREIVVAAFRAGTLAILELCNLDRIEPSSDSRQPVRHRRRLLLPRGMIVLSRADHDWSLNQDAARARVVSVM